ncbi:MAG: orotidine-5'-phosphate decarboxylase [Acidobacteria bacterium]|nr:orotidine-5'-phosphate decarboxylase [Acidobacteriota bacterium]
MQELLVALDVDSRDQALALADQLRGTVGGFKIGSRLFTIEGPSLIATLADRGDRVFLDLKYHDIPTVVAEAVRAAGRLGVWMLTVHTAGGEAMLTGAAEAAAALDQPPHVVGVTVLTSFDEGELNQIGVTRTLGDQVESLAALAVASGLDGIVASPRELVPLRERLGSAPLIVTPGIRGGAAGASGGDDQHRTLDPADALDAGASYLVVGRPIIAAADPLAAARAITTACQTTGR